MTSYVQKLAEAACIGWTKGDCCSKSTECACHGTEALAPGLRRTCPYLFGRDHHLECYRCDRSEKHPHPYVEVCDCQGRGWLLPPASEGLGVLARVAYALGFRLSGHCSGKEGSFATHRYYITLSVELNQLWFGTGETPEEALAHAICQAQGVE